MTPEEQNRYQAQLKRLGEIIVKRIEDEIQKAKFLDVFPTIGDMERLTNLENRYKSHSEVLSQQNQPLGLEMAIKELRKIENELNQERFDKEQYDTSGAEAFYEIVLANFLVKHNKRYPEQTVPHLRPGQNKQLPYVAGPIGGKKKKSRKSKKSKKNKKTRSKKQKGGKEDFGTYKDGSSVFKDKNGYYIDKWDNDKQVIYKKYLKSWKPVISDTRLILDKKTKKWKIVKSKKTKTMKKSSKKTKTSRCPNGTRKNKKSGKCENKK